MIRGNETLKQSQGVPPYGTRSYVTSQPDFKRRDYDLIALRVTQSAYFSLLTHTKKLLLVTFCDLTAGFVKWDGTDVVALADAVWTDRREG